MAESIVESSIIERTRRAKVASTALGRLSAEGRNHALSLIAREITSQAKEILAANRKDLERARPLVEAGEMPEPLYQRLRLNQSKLNDMVAGINQVAALDDPLGKVTLATQLDERLRLYRISCPIGVIGAIFESRPDALTQIASLCLKSGNAVVLKGGSEAEESNRALFTIIQSAAASAGAPAEAYVLLDSREDVSALLKAEGFVDLLIPRGSNALVRYIQNNTHIPVLGHAEGICHIYVDQSADLNKALEITLDAKLQYPAACNAVETLLVHEAMAHTFLPVLVESLKAQGVELRCDLRAIGGTGLKGVSLATEEDWSTEYCDLVLSIKVVGSLDEAIDHINRYGSHHTDTIISEDRSACEKFFTEVDSAGVYLNASTRFADGFRYGFGAEIGVSTGKLHPRGPVGLEGLTTYKYKLIGEGHTVAMYSGPDARRFIHRPIEK
jgi:glutamate-5-semialdehyde dehydrogenase